MKLLFTLLFLALFLPLTAQDTLSFGGVYELPGAEVRATYTPVSPLAQRFTIEEVYRLPGTFYDPARLVALLPGVVQTNDQANHLSVRGNTPNANLWRLNGLAIANPNHTANAGTFYDFPTLNGGGVNAISAQMLDNSGFLAGGLPVEYGYATGGTFDLRLRPGNKTSARQQAQAGFIGFDLAAEGPIGAAGNTSYLVNGRYSFTGLLADMGVDFGGEEIRFADFNGHLHHRWEGGHASLFTILGGSSNVFAFPEEEEVSEQKELFDIDYNSNLLIGGLNAEHNWDRFVIRGGLAYSSTDTERQQSLRTDPDDRATVIGNLDMLNAYAKISTALGNHGSVSLGVDRLVQNLEARANILRRLRSPEANASAVFAGYQIDKKDLKFNIGTRLVSYQGPSVKATKLEPRFSVSRRINQQWINVSLEGTGRLPTTAMVLNQFRNPVNVPITWQGALGYQRRLFGATVGATAFFQLTPAENAIRRNDFLISINNFLEFDPNYAITTTTETRRYGLELEAAGGRRDRGWYYRGSATILRAETQGIDGEYNTDRYSADYIAKLTIGREWPGNDKKSRPRVYGLNLALITHSGERYGIPESGNVNNNRPLNRYFVTPLLTEGFINSTGPYFRPDLRLYKTKTRPKTTTTLALDLQNVAGIQNTANVYYDVFLDRPNERFQLGLIPVLSYRIVWR